MSAIAGGGLFGHGVGNGWLKNVAAANTDLVFGVVSDEMGLIVALCALALFFGPMLRAELHRRLHL